MVLNELFPVYAPEKSLREPKWRTVSYWFPIAWKKYQRTQILISWHYNACRCNDTPLYRIQNRTYSEPMLIIGSSHVLAESTVELTEANVPLNYIKRNHLVNAKKRIIWNDDFGRTIVLRFGFKRLEPPPGALHNAILRLKDICKQDLFSYKMM